MSQTVLVTGGAGFIGSAVVRLLLRETDHRVVNMDSLTYAGNPEALEEVSSSSRYRFIREDIRDASATARVLRDSRPAALVHLAAETHVDRSIDGPGEFVRTNVVGTYVLLQEALKHWKSLPDDEREDFRFLQVSTDEVYGSLGESGRFTEESPFTPNSPYAATKAGADHLVRSWHRTFGFPAIRTHGCNTYGAWQFPEKLIPHVIACALEERPIPIYGRGDQVRDWLFVDDHARAIRAALEDGVPGEAYNVGAEEERPNLEVVETVCRFLDEMRPREDGERYASLITFVEDRPGHDFRYAVDAGKTREDLGWDPRRGFRDGLRATVSWYLDHEPWWRRVRETRYGGERLGSTQ